ncbi:nitrile hydratase subunit beta [Aquisalimonas asiatica]|uniref:Nitrile hydratase subunit beta n=1 Tax=Aquisalimonas asiatica TaxID=406100 RepID=A0A1H8VNY1_9GAMM|nr:nitrile hydratase subunit beta [Aquisalimonas asiatica]SEP17109.1 nitrile hydratase [Aquisalimonas asiatica]
MNGAHDLGGMHGFGAVPDVHDTHAHPDWYNRAMAMTVVMAAWGRWNIDASRRAREDMHPARYLGYGYYERWIDALERLMVEAGLVTEAELRTGEPAGEPLTPPVDAAGARTMLRRGGPTERDIDTQPRFRVGDQVVTTNEHPRGHTRLPRYARGREGIILRHHGGHVLPDTNAHFQGENPDHLYTVQFRARDLWGSEATDGDTVMLDLWETYLHAQ